ncbi:ABC transporter permease [Williamsia sp. CHRR-6]|nr:ABC transporter permease [Williamsia sp. CHRR-6]
MTHALNAERIKLLSTRSPYWCVALVIVFGLLFSLLISLTSNANGNSSDGTIVSAGDLSGGVTNFGIIVLMIMAVLAITSEFRFGTIRTTFQAVPRREVVMGAKATVYGGLGFVVTLILGVLTIVVGKLLSGDAGSAIDLTGSTATRLYWGIPVYALLCVMIGLGVGALIRQTAGAIVALMLWSLVVESLLSAIPKVRESAPYLPFNNASHFLDQRGFEIDYPWGPYVSLLYFAAWALAIFGLGVWAVRRRDA